MIVDWRKPVKLAVGAVLFQACTSLARQLKRRQSWYYSFKSLIITQSFAAILQTRRGEKIIRQKQFFKLKFKLTFLTLIVVTTAHVQAAIYMPKLRIIPPDYGCHRDDS